MCRRPLLVALAAAALAGPAGTAHAASCPGADTPVSANTLGSAKAAVLCIVNAERAARGLPTLTENDKLSLAAQRHTDDMVARNFFAHLVPDSLAAPLGRDPGARLTLAGYAWQTYGENIAAGQQTPRDVMTAWIKSHGHCRNILSPDVTQLGVGVAAVAATLPNQAGGTWTQDFGNPQGTAAPAASSGPQNGCDPSGYPALIGLDAARQPDAGTGTGTPASGSAGAGPAGGAPTGSGTPVSGPTGSATPGSGPAGSDQTPPQGDQQPPSSGVAADHGGVSADHGGGSIPARSLTISLRQVAGTLAVGGAVRPWDGARDRVSIVVRRAGHTLVRLQARLDRHGRFRVHLPVVAGSGPLVVRVSVGALRVTRTVGR
jgi:uncharacterized protein YkwD